MRVGTLWCVHWLKKNSVFDQSVIDQSANCQTLVTHGCSCSSVNPQTAVMMKHGVTKITQTLWSPCENSTHDIRNWAIRWHICTSSILSACTHQSHFSQTAVYSKLDRGSHASCQTHAADICIESKHGSLKLIPSQISAAGAHLCIHQRELLK